MKFLLKFSKPLTLILCFFLFTGFWHFGNKTPKPRTPEQEAQLAKEAEIERAAGTKVIAILPIQKAFQAPVYMSSEPAFLEKAKRMFQEKKLIFGKTIDYDPSYVDKELGNALGKRVLDHKFLIYSAEQVAPYWDYLGLDKEFSIDGLKEYVKDADAFLLVTLTSWEAESFDKEGVVRAGFQAALIDAETKQVVWTNEAKSLRLVAPSKDQLYSKYQDEMLGELAGRILKKFPKKDWK